MPTHDTSNHTIVHIDITPLQIVQALVHVVVRNALSLLYVRPRAAVVDFRD